MGPGSEHPIGSRYPNPTDHWNIEVQAPRPGVPGRYDLKKVIHIVLDEFGNVKDVF